MVRQGRHAIDASAVSSPERSLREPEARAGEERRARRGGGRRDGRPRRRAGGARASSNSAVRRASRSRARSAASRAAARAASSCRGCAPSAPATCRAAAAASTRGRFPPRPRARAHHQRLAALQLRVHGPRRRPGDSSRAAPRRARKPRRRRSSRARGRQRVALLVARRERGEGFAESFEGFPCGGGCVVVVRGGGHRLSVAVLAGVLAAASAMALAQVLEGIQQFLCDASADTVLCYWHAEAGSRRFASHGRNA